jgi:hypothetical protein
MEVAEGSGGLEAVPVSVTGQKLIRSPHGLTWIKARCVAKRQ